MCIRELGENKATLSDSPNKGGLRGLQLAANEHISPSVLSWPGHRLLRMPGMGVLFAQEEAFLALSQD